GAGGAGAGQRPRAPGRDGAAPRRAGATGDGLEQGSRGARPRGGHQDAQQEDSRLQALPGLTLDVGRRSWAWEFLPAPPELSFLQRLRFRTVDAYPSVASSLP